MGWLCTDIWQITSTSFNGKLTFEEKNIKHKLFNFRVVEFASYSDMKRALDKLDETEINGRKIRLVEDKPRRSRRYGKPDVPMIYDKEYYDTHILSSYHLSLNTY